MREWIFLHNYSIAILAILASVFTGCANSRSVQPYSNPPNDLSLASSQTNGCNNGSLFSILGKSGFSGDEYNAVNQGQYSICVVRNQTTGLVQFSITGTTTALNGRICVYPMYKAADNSLTLLDNGQCFQLSNQGPIAQRTFNTPTVNDVIIADEQVADQMYDPYNPYGSCLLGNTTRCPPYAEGTIQ